MISRTVKLYHILLNTATVRTPHNRIAKHPLTANKITEIKKFQLIAANSQFNLLSLQRFKFIWIRTQQTFFATVGGLANFNSIPRRTSQQTDRTRYRWDILIIQRIKQQPSSGVVVTLNLNLIECCCSCGGVHFGSVIVCDHFHWSWEGQIDIDRVGFQKWSSDQSVETVKQKHLNIWSWSIQILSSWAGVESLVEI